MNRLKALRRRFIVIVMIIITLMLALILSAVVLGNVQHYKTVAFESLHTLVNMTNPVNAYYTNSDRGADRFQDANRSDDQPLTVDRADDSDGNANSAAPESSPPPDATSELDAKEQKAALTLPGMVIAVDENYENPTVLFRRNIDMDETTMQDLTDAIISEYVTSDKKEGTLAEPLSLSYSVRPTPEGLKIAVVDRSYEMSNIQNLLLVCILTFIVAWVLAFLCIWRLSSWVFRPVEEAWTQQRQFIADASHELKTPLTVILANIRILKNHQDDRIADQMRWIDSSDQEALRMKKLVSDMLLLARNDANEDQPLNCEPVLFSDVVLGAILSFESVALDNGLRIHEQLVENASLEGDKAQLEELVNILLDNACKYAPPGSVIDVKLEQQEKSLSLSVHNQGSPFDDDTLQHLFKRFYRVDASRTRQTGGYGLGLAIADSICQRHQGHISAANEGDGVTFYITLPLTQRHRK